MFVLDYSYVIRKIGGINILLPIGPTGKNYIIKIDEKTADFFEILKKTKDVETAKVKFASQYGVKFEDVNEMINEILKKIKIVGE